MAISSKEDSIAEQDCGNKEGNVTGTSKAEAKKKNERGERGGGALDGYIDYRDGVSALEQPKGEEWKREGARTKERT